MLQCKCYWGYTYLKSHSTWCTHTCSDMEQNHYFPQQKLFIINQHRVLLLLSVLIAIISSIIPYTQQTNYFNKKTLFIAACCEWEIMWFNLCSLLCSQREWSHAGREEMPHTAGNCCSPHHLGPVHGQQGSEVQRQGDIVGSYLAGYGGQPTAGQAGLAAAQQWTLHRTARLKVLLLSRKAFLCL